MSKKARTEDPQTSGLRALIDAIAARDEKKALLLLAASPELARQAVVHGATRQAAAEHFYAEIGHYVYEGDTALHVAAAAYQRGIAAQLVANGANPGARNRRGAEPLHYAADGGPGTPSWNPGAQAAIIEYLIEAGADPNSADKSGVAPLHRAVRTRCTAAVKALLTHGADVGRKNGSGSTPLHLAVQTTGRGGSGSTEAREQQREIITLLLCHGADPRAEDARGKTAEQSATSDWTREILAGAIPSKGHGETK